MQLKCPDCGAPVPSENINIQRMTAVCPSCHAVFQFDPPASKTKIKHRKVKQPQQIASIESDGHVTIAFRTNFRLERNQAFTTSALMSVVFTFMTILMASKAFVNPQATLVTAGFGLLSLFLYYRLALVVYNKTAIEISDEEIKVSRKPLPNFLSQPNTINLAGIEIIRYEETVASRKEGYDTPRYNVWAEVVDGNRKLIVGDVIEDYAVFISQRLNELLDLESAPDTTRLLDGETVVEDAPVPDEFIPRSKSLHT